MKKVGRNDPCPCGSKRKVKNCCGMGMKGKKKPSELMPYLIKLFREVAYVGEIGKRREKFCRTYIESKNSLYATIKNEQEKVSKRMGKSIQCKKGCFNCCAQHIGGTLQECEVIIYYLYHNKHAFDLFVRKYPKWRNEIKGIEDLFQRMGILHNEYFSSGMTPESRAAYIDQGEEYLKQNIFCPFLNEQECIIYNVRPKACASIVSINPPEWCSGLNNNAAKQIAFISQDPEPSYFYGTDAHLTYTTIPLMVYQIIINGYLHISTIPGREGIDGEAFRDPEVRAIFRERGFEG